MSLQLPSISDRVGNFQFLTGKRGEASVDADALEAAAQGIRFSQEDAAIFRTLLEELRETGTFAFGWTPQEANYVKNNDASKVPEYLVYRYKFKVFPATHRVADFPVYLLVEPTSACNLRCTVCFQVDRSFTMKPFMGLIDVDFYKRVIDEAVAGGTKAVTLASRGEPTLHPRLGEMLEYSAGKFIELKINTNATKLTEKLCHQIIDSGVNELVFSIDSHEKHIYQAIRVRGKFDQVLENVAMFQKIRAEHPNSKTSTRVSGVRFRADQDGDAFVKFWSKYVDEVGYVDCEERWDTYQNAPKDVDHSCAYLWERMYVWFDGKCNPCDVDYKSLLTPGSVKEQSLRDIWHGDFYTKLRKAHVDGTRSQYNPCDRCGI